MSTHHRPPPPSPGTDGLPWTASDALVAVAAAALDLLGYSMGGPDGSPPIALTAVVLLVLGAVPLLTRRRYPLASLSGVLVLGLALNLSVAVPQHFNCALCVALFAVARSRGIAVAAARPASSRPRCRSSGGATRGPRRSPEWRSTCSPRPWSSPRPRC